MWTKANTTRSLNDILSCTNIYHNNKTSNMTNKHCSAEDATWRKYKKSTFFCTHSVAGRSLESVEQKQEDDHVEDRTSHCTCKTVSMETCEE